MNAIRRERSTLTQLLIMLALPILGLIVFAVIAVMGALAEWRSSQKSQNEVEAAIITSKLVHEQQKERGLSNGYLASRGETFRDALIGQRKETDARMERFMAVATALTGSGSLSDDITVEITVTVERIRACMCAAEHGMADGTQRVREALLESARAESSMEDIRTAAAVVIGSIDQIAGTLREQSGASQDISRNAVAIADGSAQLSHGVASMADTARHLELLAGKLDQSVKRFRIA